VKKVVYLSLGSNLGGRLANLEAAILHLGELGRLMARSSIYETEPVDVIGQPWFLNCVVAIETELMPKQFLSRAMAIERRLGRRRTQEKGPRTLDIDLLLFGSSVVDTPTLVIPHPTMHKRRFVLEPLAEIASEVRHPVFKKTVREMLNALPPQAGAVRRLRESGDPGDRT
jgi:2-amino-4-hydroxy-6-hydroxymethyldihydropteridine diphosphokinase